MSVPEQEGMQRKIGHGDWTECHTTFVGQAALGFDQANVAQWDVFSGGGTPGGVQTLSPTGVITGEGTLGGVQLLSLEGISSEPVVAEGGVVGRSLEDASADYCFLGGLYPRDLTASPEAQTEEVFGRIEGALARVGMDFRHVVRTWFYNDRILDWYDGFNRVRTAFFRAHGISLMPASTGIGAPNMAGAALVAKVIAIRPKTSALRIRKAVSPLQNDAFDYGSAFSRGISVEGPHARSLYISGTASIGADGATLHAGNPSLQIAQTMEVVGAMLGAAGMDFGDTTRAVAYFRHPEHLAVWRAFCRGKSLQQLPVIEVGSTICRDDLLFEIELDAARELVS
jgi:enamine deaminase RidA (YjgF/YER057c/UK114 family)